MIGTNENDLIQMSVKFKNSQLAGLNQVQEDCGFATLSETVRYVVQKGLVLIEKEKAILSNENGPAMQEASVQ